MAGSPAPPDRSRCAGFFWWVFGVDAAAFGAVVGPRLWNGQAMRARDAFTLFPILVLSVGLLGIVFVRRDEGRAGLRALGRRTRTWRVGLRWYALLLVPPVLVCGILLSLSAVVSPAFRPNRFWLGACFGIFPGFVEELGWTGYALPRLWARFGRFRGAVLLGVAWSAWHAPVVDFLGARAPHGAWLPAFFAAFAVIMTAMRVLTAWAFERTGSLLLVQLVHASSTASLVIFSATRVTAGQETLWYLIYGGLLWLGILASPIGRVWGKPTPPDTPGLAVTASNWWVSGMPKPVTPLVGCDVFIVDERGRVLLVRRSDNGFWALPGGCQDLGETPAECAVREAREETGFQVKVTRLLGVMSSLRYPYVNYPWKDNEFTHIVFAAEIVGGSLAGSAETPEVDFFEECALPPLSDGNAGRIRLGYAALKEPLLPVAFE